MATAPEPATAAPAKRPSRGRGIVVVVLLVLAPIVFFVGALATWVDRTALDNATWGDVTEQIVHDPAVSVPLSDALAQRVQQRADFQGRLSTSLPAEPPAAGGTRGGSAERARPARGDASRRVPARRRADGQGQSSGTGAVDRDHRRHDPARRRRGRRHAQSQRPAGRALGAARAARRRQQSSRGAEADRDRAGGEPQHDQGRRRHAAGTLDLDDLRRSGAVRGSRVAGGRPPPGRVLERDEPGRRGAAAGDRQGRRRRDPARARSPSPNPARRPRPRSGTSSARGSSTSRRRWPRSASSRSPAPGWSARRRAPRAPEASWGR